MFQAEKIFNHWAEQAKQSLLESSPFLVQEGNEKKIYNYCVSWIEAKVNEKIGVNPILTVSYRYNMNELARALKSQYPEVDQLVSLLGPYWIFKENWLPFKDGSLIVVKNPTLETIQGANFLMEIATNKIAKSILNLESPIDPVLVDLAKNATKATQYISPQEAVRHLKKIQYLYHSMPTVVSTSIGTGRPMPMEKVIEILSEFLVDPGLVEQKEFESEMKHVM